MAIRRGVGLVLTLIGLAFLVSISALAAVYVAVSREPIVANRSTLLLRIGGELSESPPQDVVGQFVSGPRPPTVRGLIDNLRKAKVDQRVSALVLMPSTIEIPYWGKVQELRDAILDFRRSGKPAVAYLEYGGDREYYLASACDRVFLMPTSPLNLTGLASYELFLRGTLDKIGAYPDLLHIGEYKTGSNQLTEKTFTPAHREMSESLNRDMYEQLVRGIADARKKPEHEVRALLNEGPFLPEDALRAGLVDDLAYEDQIDDKVNLGSRQIKSLEADDYSRISLTSLGLNKGPRIAVIYASGTIVSGRSGFDPVDGPVVGSDTLTDSIREARADSSVRAIILRVDSPGGSSVASDVIWRELVLTRNEKADRPLVASMSDLAASGGYYLAMAASAIVAEPATLTGSIGIYGGKIVTGGTFAKLGANIEPISIGRNAEIYSPVRPFNASERAKIEEQLQAYYDQFVEKVAAARHMTPERVDQVGQGRVWTGRQAKQLGLVDALGGLDRAVALAKQRARIPQDAEVELVSYPPRKSLYELVTERFSGAGDLGALAPIARLDQRRALGALAAPLRLFRRGEPLALMPFTFLR